MWVAASNHNAMAVYFDVLSWAGRGRRYCWNGSKTWISTADGKAQQVQRTSVSALQHLVKLVSDKCALDGIGIFIRGM